MMSYAPVKVECKHRRLHQVFGDHVVEHRHHLVDRDGRVAHTKDPIELGSDESNAWLFRSLSKRLILDGHVSNLKREKEMQSSPILAVFFLFFFYK